MYRYLRGKVVEKRPTEVVLDVGGVGYQLRVPLTTSAALSEKGEATLHTVLVHREDEMSLYGFSSREDRDLFNDLLRVTGIGPQTALAVLSGGPIEEIRRAIRRHDEAWLTSIRGVGSKTCQRIFLELSPRFGEEPADAGAAGDDAVAALVSLGYERKEAARRVGEAARTLGADAPADRLIQAAVRAKIRA